MIDYEGFKLKRSDRGKGVNSTLGIMEIGKNIVLVLFLKKKKNK